MKLKLVAVLSVLILLTGCGLGGSNQVKKDLETACELVNARAANDPPILPESVEFFASAARADIQYLPLAHAARVAQMSPFESSDAIDTEIVKATTLILGYCKPRLAE